MEDKDKKEPRKILTPAEWLELEAMWASGLYTLAALSDKCGLRTETLSRRFKARGVVKGGSEVTKAVTEAVIEDAADKTKARLDKIEKRREFYDTSALLISQLTRKEITDAVKEARPVATIEDNIKSLQRASITLSKCWDISCKALNMDHEDIEKDDLPDLVFSELTAEQVAHMRQMQSGEDTFMDDLIEEEVIATIEDDSKALLKATEIRAEIETDLTEAREEE